MPSTLTVPKLDPTAPAAVSTDLPGRISGVATTILSDVLLLAGIVAVFYIIYGGYLYISSSGDAAKAKSAQGTILNAVIGVTIIVSAFALVQLAVRTGGVLKGGSDSHLAVNGSDSADQVNTYSTKGASQSGTSAVNKDTETKPTASELPPHNPNNPYVASGPEYSLALINPCTDGSSALVHGYCYDPILHDHATFCAGVYDAGKTSRYCSSSANGAQDKRLYCNDILYLANANQTYTPYTECRELTAK